MCVYRYRGQSTADSRFFCYDRFANQRSMPIDDNTGNTVDIDTQVSFNEGTKKATLTAIFDKPLFADESSQQDYNMTNGASFNAIWAHAPITGGTQQSHTSGATARGTFWMQLNYLRNGATQIALNLIVILGSMLLIISQ